MEISVLVVILFLFPKAFSSNCYDDHDCYRFSMFGIFICSVALFVLVLNHRNSFNCFVGWIADKKICKMELPTLIISMFLMLGLIDFVLLSVSARCEQGDVDCDEPLLNPDAGQGEVRHITRSLTAVCVILFGLTVLAYWDTFSYTCAHYSWVHAILYCTGIGWVFLVIARWLKPPTKTDIDRDDVDSLEWSWHMHHPVKEVLDWVMLFILVLMTMFVYLSAITVAIFTEIARESQE